MTTTAHQCSAGTRVGVTVGVEEEFVLTDGDGRPVPAAAEVLGRAPATGELQPELAGCQVELATPICTGGEDVLAQLGRLRQQLAIAAGEQGLLLLASGTPLLAGPGTVLARGERYRRIARHYRALTDAAHVCGCHVHVAVPGRDVGVRVSNYLRAWLPALLAAGANSPFVAGRDSGYASWRHQLMVQWPASGPPPYFESVDHHDSVMSALAQSGGVLDPANVYWDVRLSPRYPTVEVRVCDVAATSTEAALLAVLVRALAVMAESGDPADRVPGEVLRADLWRAARDGLAGRCAAPAGSVPVPAALAIRRVVEHARPALRAHNEEEFAESLVHDLLQAGDGATRQRAAYRRHDRLSDVAAALAVQATTGRLLPGRSPMRTGAQHLGRQVSR